MRLTNSRLLLHGCWAVVVMALSTLPSGCGSGESTAQKRLRRNVEATEDKHVDNSDGAGKKLLVQERDFGLLKPKEAVEHRFSIRNPSYGKWTVRKIINMCSCTATDLSSPVIEAGSEQTVTVRYRAGSVTQDDRRKVVVLFEEAEAPQVVLVVRAQVREDMTCLPSELQFAQLGRGQSRRSTFEVQNFADSDWGPISLKPSVPWLEVSSAPLEVAQGGRKGTPRQAWRITVLANATRMTAGSHDGEIVVAALAEGITRRIAVHANVVSPVVAIPEQFFFGNVEVGKSVTRSITLRFAPEAIPKNTQAVRLQHSLGRQLRLNWLKAEGDIWELEATFTLDRLDAVGDQRVNISFPESRLPSLALPVYLWCETK